MVVVSAPFSSSNGSSIVPVITSGTGTNPVSPFSSSNGTSPTASISASCTISPALSTSQETAGTPFFPVNQVPVSSSQSSSPTPTAGTIRSVVISPSTSPSETASYEPTIPAQVGLTDDSLRGSEPVEYAPEPTFAKKIANPDMQWVGLVTSYESTQTTDASEYSVPSAGNPETMAHDDFKYAEEIEADIEYVPQDIAFLEYFLGSSSQASDSIQSIQLGEWSGGQFRRLLGCIGQSISLSIAQDSVARASASFLAADKTNWQDYSYTNNHATDPGTTPLTYDDLGNIQIDGVDFSQYVTSLTINIDNSFNILTTDDSTLDTKMFLVYVEEKEVTIEMEISHATNEMADVISSFGEHDLSFDFGGSTFTFSGLRFPEYTQPNAVEVRQSTITTTPAKNVVIN